MEEQKIELKMIRMSEVQAQEIEWLWYPFIPYGKLTIIQGDPGDGKTTMVLNLAAKLSKGEALDENMKVTEPVNVIYQTAEDGLADTVKPRLELAGADCDRIIPESVKFHFYKNKPISVVIFYRLHTNYNQSYRSKGHTTPLNFNNQFIMTY